MKMQYLPRHHRKQALVTLVIELGGPNSPNNENEMTTESQRGLELTGGH